MIIDGQRVTSPEDGFEIEFDPYNRTKLIYREGDKKTILAIQPLIGGIALEWRSIVRWAAPFEEIRMTEIDKKRIAYNISQAVSATNLDLILDTDV